MMIQVELVCRREQDRASHGALVVKKPPASAGDVRHAGSVPGLEDPLEEGLPGAFGLQACACIGHLSPPWQTASVERLPIAVLLGCRRARGLLHVSQ